MKKTNHIILFALVVIFCFGLVGGMSNIMSPAKPSQTAHADIGFGGIPELSGTENTTTTKTKIVYEDKALLTFNNSHIYSVEYAKGKQQLVDMDNYPIMTSDCSPVLNLGYYLSANDTGFVDINGNGLVIKKTFQGDFYLVDTHGKVVRGGFKKVDLAAQNTFWTKYTWSIESGKNGIKTTVIKETTTLVFTDYYTINGDQIKKLSDYLAQFVLVGVVASPLTPVMVKAFAFSIFLLDITDIVAPEEPVYSFKLDVTDISGQDLFLSDFAEELQVVDSKNYPIMTSYASPVFVDEDLEVFTDLEGNVLTVVDNILIDNEGKKVFGAAYIVTTDEFKNFERKLTVAPFKHEDGYRILCMTNYDLATHAAETAIVMGSWIALPFIAENSTGNFYIYDVLYREIDKAGNVIIAPKPSVLKQVCEFLAKELEWDWIMPAYEWFSANWRLVLSIIIILVVISLLATFAPIVLKMLWLVVKLLWYVLKTLVVLLFKILSFPFQWITDRQKVKSKK